MFGGDGTGIETVSAAIFDGPEWPWQAESDGFFAMPPDKAFDQVDLSKRNQVIPHTLAVELELSEPEAAACWRVIDETPPVASDVLRAICGWAFPITNARVLPLAGGAMWMLPKL